MESFDALSSYLQNDWSLQLPEHADLEKLTGILASRIHELIHHDLNQLVNVLYRIDVDEFKLNQMLKNNDEEDPSFLIAKLIIDRQLQKIETRRFYSERSKSDDEEEW